MYDNANCIFLLLSASVIPESSLSVGVGLGSSVVGAAVVSGSVELSITEIQGIHIVSCHLPRGSKLRWCEVQFNCL